MNSAPINTTVNSQDKGKKVFVNPDTDLNETFNKKASDKAFPVHAFPADIQRIINATNQSLNYPVDFTGGAILFAASLAIGNTHMVEIMKGYEQNAVLFLAIVGRPGTIKSHPLSFALQPAFKMDAESYQLYAEQKKEFDRLSSLSKTEREQQHIDEPVKPVWQKRILSDFTAEALAVVHLHNKRGIAVYVDEMAGWFKNMTRYNKGSEMEFWLSQWSSKPINIDRKTGDSIYIPAPFVSVAGTIQTGMLTEIAKDNRTQNGFIDRILFAFPSESKKAYWAETQLDQAIIYRWEAIFSRLSALECTTDEALNPISLVLRFAPDAKKLLTEWQRENTDECNSADDAGASIYSKLEIYAIRLSLILEMLHYACGESTKEFVTIKSVEGALQLIDYFKGTALKVHALLSNADPLDKQPADKQLLYNTLPDSFTTETGLQVARDLRVAERTFKRFLNEKELFNRVSRGEYEKRF